MTTYLQTIPPQVRRTAKQNQNGLRYIEKSNGDLLYNQKPKSWKERDWKIQQFRNDYIFTLSINENRYKEPLSQLICDTVPEVEIAEQLYFTRKTFEYIFV
jgi:hypothetical protein